MECELCGGTNFFKEFGYFFCNECQTQSQEFREHVFQKDEINNRKSSKKLKDDRKGPTQVTSWECYNVIMFCLTRDLIKLGAKEELKRVIKCLWLRYMEKLEVFNVIHDIMPKLQLINSTRDANILRGHVKRKRKRKRKASSSSADLSPVTHLKSSKRREITRKKTALVHSYYEEVSQLTQDSLSVHNETLSSLKGESEKSVDDIFTYNHYISNELKRAMPKGDCQSNIDNDRKNRRLLKSKALQYGVYYISPIKLYSLLYLGLLVIRDNLQVGDIIRFIREGRLCFNNYKQLFPEEYADKILNIINFSKSCTFSSDSIRDYTAKLANFLEVTGFIVVPDCVRLCHRYCEEMNLPGDFRLAVENIISKTLPKLSIKGEWIPNYEGRIMALIFFALKLLYSFDGVAEFHFTNANCVNDSFNRNMFDVISWIQCITYRKLFLKTHHFPSSHSYSNELKCDMLLEYVLSQNISLNSQGISTQEMKDYEDILIKIKGYQFDSNLKKTSISTLSPFAAVLENRSKPFFVQNYEKREINFLIEPNKYFNSLDSSSAQVKDGSANDKWIINEFKNFKNKNSIERTKHSLVLIEVVDNGNDIIIENHITNGINLEKGYVRFQERNFENQKQMFHKHLKFEKKMSKRVAKNKSNNVPKINVSSKTLYNPFEKYWINIAANIDVINRNSFECFFENHSVTFKLLFDECSRVIEQSYFDFFKEFQVTETFLTHSSTLLKGDSCISNTIGNAQWNCHMMKAKKHW